jgi:hypothetical protein
MKNIIIIGFIGLAFNGISQNISGRTFTNTFPKSTSAIIKTLRFLDDTTVVFTRGSMNYRENTRIDTLKYVLENSYIVFLSKIPEDISISENLIIIDSSLFDKIQKSKKKKHKNIRIGNYWYESTNDEKKNKQLYLTKK